MNKGLKLNQRLFNKYCTNCKHLKVKGFLSTRTTSNNPEETRYWNYCLQSTYSSEGTAFISFNNKFEINPEFRVPQACPFILEIMLENEKSV